MKPAPSQGDPSAHEAWRGARALRFAWALASAFIVESLVIGLAALPATLFWKQHVVWLGDLALSPFGLVVLAMALLPAYLIFAGFLMALSAGASALFGWRPQPDAELRIADLEPALADWARYGILNHVVRVLVGPALRNTPVWVWYMRANGARIGRRVWVNSLDVTDHCLLDFGDDVVIGAGAHLSGHTVERGIVRTAAVRLGAGTVVGVNCHVEIDVETGPGCQIGSLAMVPKGSRLKGNTTYVGAPVHELVHPKAPEG